MWEYNYNDTLTHHGIKGQEWGVRRFQNEDGSLTSAGEQRYLTGRERREAKRVAKVSKKIEKQHKNAGDALGRADYYKRKGDEASAKYDENARVWNKAAKQHEKEGNFFRAEAFKRMAQKEEEKSAAARKDYDAQANEWLQRSERYTQKASKISTKKNVDVGKQRVDEIISVSRQKGYDSEKRYNDYASEEDNDDN